jgi:hypothetical protein
MNSHYSALDCEELISDKQWIKLAKLSKQFNLPVSTILAELYWEPNSTEERDDHQNFVGKIPISKRNHLYGMLHYSGSLHT